MVDLINTYPNPTIGVLLQKTNTSSEVLTMESDLSLKNFGDLKKMIPEIKGIGISALKNLLFV